MTASVVVRGAGPADLEALVSFTLDDARAAGALDLRRYAHLDNARAPGAYRRLGFVETPYVILRRPPG